MRRESVDVNQTHLKRKRASHAPSRWAVRRQEVAADGSPECCERQVGVPGPLYTFSGDPSVAATEPPPGALMELLIIDYAQPRLLCQEAFIEERVTMDSEEIRVIIFLESEKIRVWLTLDFEDIRVTLFAILLLLPFPSRHCGGIFARTRPQIGHGDPRSPRPPPPTASQPLPLARAPLPARIKQLEQYIIKVQSGGYASI